MAKKNNLKNGNFSKKNSDLIKILSWLIVGLCVGFIIIGFQLHKNVYMPIFVIILASTISLYNLERENLKRADYFNLYLAAVLDVIALVLYFLQSMGKI